MRRARFVCFAAPPASSTKTLHAVTALTSVRTLVRGLTGLATELLELALGRALALVLATELLDLLLHLLESAVAVLGGLVLSFSLLFATQSAFGFVELLRGVGAALGRLVESALGLGHGALHRGVEVFAALFCAFGRVIERLLGLFATPS